MYDWNILLYTFTDNDLEVGSFKDIAKLTALNNTYPNVVVNMLLDTATMGSYRIRLSGNPYNHGDMHIRRVSNQNMSDPSTLRRFIESALRHDPARKICLILGGHGSGWYLFTEKNSILPITLLNKTLCEAKIHLDILCLDNCLMSCLETANELAPSVDYIVAFQNYCPWDGIIGPKLLTEFAQRNDTLSILTALQDDFILRAKDEEADCSILITKEAKRLARLLKDKVIPFADVRVDKEYPHLLDLYSLASSIPGFAQQFSRTVYRYVQASAKPRPDLHGLSCIYRPEIDESDPYQGWKGLRCGLIIN
jgi:Clostripain family